MSERILVRGLDVSAILHEEDKSIMEKLHKIPRFKSIVEKTVGNIMEKYATIEYSAEGVNVSSLCMPDIHRRLLDVCRILDMTDVPACSTDWFYNISCFSVGEKNRRIVLQSGAVDLLTDEELDFIFGHEIGHMRCGHKVYHMLTEAMYRPRVASDLKFRINLIRMPLLNWYRVSDFTADRMGLLCCQDINVALSAMIKMAGLPRKYYDQLHIESFIRQAEEFKETYSGLMDKIIKYFSINAACMPWLVLRASELLEWYNSGEYHRILKVSQQYN